ncbi:molecular chaperone [Stutzerimonas stutzeri]|uniref:Molecular chaperone n=1 Tax=Stutzerimonas stutzeri TaxID=316 RepID=W8QYJ1_STUST|nr:molecular chaperone [Stutzerimonas stutzeri]AHL75369.1 molecular chaperone [Stutzerimonas stutzeri]MCQ4328076.1 molecular chaperone [Stutzerimonas stutzeri]
MPDFLFRKLSVRPFRLAAIALLTTCSAMAEAASSVLIWPINPTIEADASAAALWLENRGQAPVRLQVRVLDWSQQDLNDQLEPQQQVVGSPPMATVEPGKRQLVRLIRRQPAPAGQEQAFRVIVDELLPERTQRENDLGVQFQMRYSVPLFVYGAGATVPGKNKSGEADGTDLSFRIAQDSGQSYLYVKNSGTVHARMSQASLMQGARKLDIAQGLLGYVLPASEMRWPLPPGTPSGGASLLVRVNEQGEAQTIEPK